MKTKLLIPLGLLLTALILVFSVLPEQTASAAPPPGQIDVTTTVDENGGNANNCSLREAIQSVKAELGVGGCTLSGYPPYTINLPAGTYVLTGAANENLNQSGDLDISASMTIAGAGRATTFVDGGGIDRVFHVCPNGGCAIEVTLHGITIQNGSGVTEGGGLHNNGGTVTLEASTVSNNQATTRGGGIVCVEGTTIVDASTVKSNQANHGGGIINNAILYIMNGSLIGGKDTGNVALSGNGGGIYNFAGTILMDGSAMIDNTASNEGGGVYNRTQLGISNSTISANQANDHGGGLYNTETGNAYLLNVTISDNTADSDGDDNGNGGGIFRNGGTVSIQNTIIAGNVDDTPEGGSYSPDCTGTLNSLDYNLIGDPTFCNLINTVANTITGQAALLAPLTDNGGATPTHALLAGSPALDHIATGVSDCGNDPIDKDQRGVGRPQGTACDIGAYEAAPELSINKTVTPETNVPYHDNVTYVIALDNDSFVPAAGVTLTDTLPTEVDFDHWVNMPPGASVVGDVLTWSGSVPADDAVTISFSVIHVGDYGDIYLAR